MYSCSMWREGPFPPDPMDIMARLCSATAICHRINWVAYLRLFSSTQTSTSVHQGLVENIFASCMNICTCNVSVVRINGNIITVGSPTLRSYDATRFGARARAFESCKGCVAAWFGVHWFARMRFRVQVSDMTSRVIGFVLLMYPLYG